MCVSIRPGSKVASPRSINWYPGGGCAPVKSIGDPVPGHQHHGPVMQAEAVEHAARADGKHGHLSTGDQVAAG
jgi:hypothetical protein